MRGRLANTVRLRVAAETQPLIRLRAGPQTPSPKGEGISSQKLPPSLQNGYNPRPLHILWLYSLCRGILYAGTCFSVYAALELAWRGTTHWTMFMTGGVCLCLLQALADRPLPLGLAAAVGAAGVSGLELAVGAVCRRVLHTAVWDYADEWGNLAGLVCPKYTAYWFLLCGWVIFVLRGVESTVYHPQKSVSRH